MSRKHLSLILLAALVGCLVLPWALGQPPSDGLPADRTTPPIQQAKYVNPAKRDLNKLSLLEREVYLAGQRGSEWLQRANRPDGRFLCGYLPDLRCAMESDHYLQQIEGALALARTARYYEDVKAAALARQAVLSLLLETQVDQKSPNGVRHTIMPPALVNRTAAAGLLVLAIHQLPSPQKDILEQAAQLCNYLRLQQQSDGSLKLAAEGLAVDDSIISYCTGPALCALMHSPLSPSARLEVLGKAANHYLTWWRQRKNMVMIPWHTAAYAQAYLVSRKQVFADCVFEMNDWLCERQYEQVDPRHPLWRGGFKGWRSGAEVLEAPEAGSAPYVESLVHACRVAREAGDVRRWQSYKDAAERGVQFLTTLQYTDANTQHFAPWYRPTLLGAFHGSHQDGNLRLDYTSRSVAALVLFLQNTTP